MFTEKRQRFLFKAAKLLLDRDGRRSAEVVLQIEPFTNTMENRRRYDDLVLVVFGDGESIADGFQDATWGPGLGLQGATFRLDPDMDPEFASSEVRVLKYKATRCEGKDDPDWVRFAITIDVPLNERKAREFVVNHFGHDVFVESWAVQATLADDDTVLEG